MKANMNMHAIIDKINTPLQFAALALLVLSLMKVRSNKKFVWLFVFSASVLVVDFGLAYLDKPPTPSAPVTVTNTGQGGAAVGTNSGTINVVSGNGK